MAVEGKYNDFSSMLYALLGGNLLRLVIISLASCCVRLVASRPHASFAGFGTKPKPLFLPVVLVLQHPVSCQFTVTWSCVGAFPQPPDGSRAANLIAGRSAVTMTASISYLTLYIPFS